MKSRTSKSKMFRQTLLILLPLWWGGLNCVTACSAAMLNTATPETCAAEAGEHDCCVKLGQPGDVTWQAPSIPAQHDCSALENLQGSLPSKQSPAAKRLAPPFLSAGLSLLPAVAFTKAWSWPASRWRDGQRTHLQCCVFLI